MGHPYWPLFDLRLRTPRLELRVPTDEDLCELARVAASGIHDASFMPFSQPWTDQASPRLERGLLQWHWRIRAGFRPEDWWLDLAVIAGGRIVGVQGLTARAFPVMRTVATGSWLGRAHQGQGIGTEMREAVLHLAFEVLGAELATSSAFADNEASERVSRRLGYRENGIGREAPRGVVREVRHFLLDREGWASRARAPVTVEGLAPCWPLFFGQPAPPAVAAAEAAAARRRPAPADDGAS